MSSLTGRIGIALILVLAGGGAVFYIGNRPANVSRPTAPPSSIVHSAAWYVAHPDVLHEDEKRCAGDATTMSLAACQNVASADAQLNVIEMRNAAGVNQDAGSQVGTDPKSK